MKNRLIVVADQSFNVGQIVMADRIIRLDTNRSFVLRASFHKLIHGTVATSHVAVGLKEFGIVDCCKYIQLDCFEIVTPLLLGFALFESFQSELSVGVAADGSGILLDSFGLRSCL